MCSKHEGSITKNERIIQPWEQLGREGQADDLSLEHG